MVQITISPKFISQLKEISGYLTENRSVEFAQALVGKAFEEIADLQRFPQRWQQIEIPGVDGEFRRILLGVYQIFYEKSGEQITIHSIIDGRRRPPLFRPN